MSVMDVPEPTVKVWRPQGFAGVELEKFDYMTTCHLPKRFMLEYDITVTRIYEGNAKIFYRGEKQVVTPHRELLYLQHAGEMLEVDAPACDVSAWTLRIYQTHIHELLRELGVERESVFFPQMLIADTLNSSLCRLAAETIDCFDRPSSNLEREFRLLGLLYAVLKHCSDTPPPEVKLGKEHKAVVLVKEVLHAHPEQDLKLDDLGEMANLSKFHLMRVFQRDVGLSPHKYQTGLRINLAKDKLAKGAEIVDVALDLGFNDQAHFTRTFETYTQTTPGRFRQDSLAS